MLAASPAAEEDDVLTGPSPSPPVGGVMDERPTATIVQSVQRAGTDGDDTANARQQENEGQRDDDLFMLPVNNGEQAGKLKSCTCWGPCRQLIFCTTFFYRVSAVQIFTRNDSSIKQNINNISDEHS